MNNYFSLTIEEQRQVLQAAEGRIGLPAQAIEKDLWVTTILQIVFTLPFADKLIFKGGTSLSKVGKHISRFSEDIDLAIDRSQFGLEGDLTKKQIKKLRKRIVLIPREDIISVWEMDYAEMLVNMIYGTNKPTFNQIIEKMQVLQDRFRQQSL